jgi:hypothetical protein
MPSAREWLRVGGLAFLLLVVFLLLVIFGFLLLVSLAFGGRAGAAVWGCGFGSALALSLAFDVGFCSSGAWAAERPRMRAAQPPLILIMG